MNILVNWLTETLPLILDGVNYTVQPVISINFDDTNRNKFRWTNLRL